MRLRLTCLLALLALAPHGADAQLMTTGIGAAPGAAYTGPGDIVSGATAWWGLRAYSGNYAATLGAALTVYGNSTGSGTPKVIHVTAAGGLNATDVSFCTTGGNTFCNITNLKDQTGNGNDITQSAGANAPTLGTCGSLPCWVSSGSQYFINRSVPSGSFPMTFSTVSERTSVDASHFDALVGMFTSSAGPAIEWNTSANSVVAGPGTGGVASCSVSDNALHAFQAVLNAASTLNCDGTDNTASGGTTGSTTQIGVNANPLVTVSQIMTGDQSEVGWWNGTGFSSAQRTAMHANQSVYWGTP